MKRNGVFRMAMLVVTLVMVGFTSCSDDNNGSKGKSSESSLYRKWNGSAGAYIEFKKDGTFTIMGNSSVSIDITGKYVVTRSRNGQYHEDQGYRIYEMEASDVKITVAPSIISKITELTIYHYPNKPEHIVFVANGVALGKFEK